MTRKKTTPAQLDDEIAAALSKELPRSPRSINAVKTKLTAEYHALKHSLANPTLSKADAQELRSKLAAIDAELVALNTAEYTAFLSKPRKGGY